VGPARKIASIALIVYVTICIVAVVAIPKKPGPLSLPWGKKDDSRIGRLEIPHYKYIYGSPGWGSVYYTGSEDIAGMSNELILYYAHRKLSSILLILGPAGINEDNCIRKYRQILSLLNKKYGHFKYQARTTDPLKDDLLFSRECYAIRAGLEVFETKWILSNFRVSSFLFGDEDDLFIEIEYVLLSLENEEKKSQDKEDLKRL